MMLDNRGLPATINHLGQYDYGDSLANYCRWKVAQLALTPNEVTLKEFPAYVDEQFQLRRHPGNGISPDGTTITNYASFWTDPKEVSRDNSRACHWLMALSTKYPNISDKTFAVLQMLKLKYEKDRKSLYAQNKDIMFPFQFAQSGIKLLLRDLEIGVGVAVQVGLIPIFKHDKPFGLGYKKSITFTWLDADEVDADANLVCDLVAANLNRPTKLLTFMTAVYRKFRGARGVRHYYRKESGNNPELAELYVQALDLK